MVDTLSISKSKNDVVVLCGEIVRVLSLSIKTLPGMEMQKIGSEMLKNKVYQQEIRQNQVLSSSIMVQDFLLRMGMSVLSWRSMMMA